MVAAVRSRETEAILDVVASAAWRRNGMEMDNAHISALASKHADLEARINDENQRPQPDMTVLSRLKKEKLKLKEAMSGL